MGDGAATIGCVLGIDAAWTADQPSGVALVVGGRAGWRCVAVAPSHERFLALADRTSSDWGGPCTGCVPDVKALLATAAGLAGRPVDLVTIDMPVATGPVSGRRVADNAVSSTYGARGCSVHTATRDRPGALGASLSAGFATAGFDVATSATAVGTPRRLLEVYPHPAGSRSWVAAIASRTRSRGAASTGRRHPCRSESTCCWWS